MHPNKRELDLRKDLDTFMRMGAEGLSPSSAKWLSKQRGLKSLLPFLAQATPRTVRAMFASGLKEAMKVINESPRESSQKRPAAESQEASCAKKARKEGVEQLGKILSQRTGAQVQSGESEAMSHLRKTLEEDGEDDVVLASEQASDFEEEYDDVSHEEEQDSFFVGENSGIQMDNQSFPEDCNAESDGKIEKVSSVELGLTQENQPVLEQVAEECHHLLPERGDRLQSELKPIFKACSKLSFLKVQYQLVQFLESRYKAPQHKMQKLPSSWETSDPHSIFNNLQIDNKAKLADLLQEIVVDGAETQISPAEMTRIVDRYKEEYNAGRKWLEVSLWFGGMGAVLVFVVAGLPVYQISKEWTMAQRRCFEHIASHFLSIKSLVQNLGPTSLKDFCENGYLAEEIIAKIGQVEGPERSWEEDVDDEEEESDEDSESSF
ncbi:MAG: hypothetical protein Q9191_004188 [Dirinaria sp. TL-2023a]